MSEWMSVAIDASIPNATVYRAMAARSRDVQIVDDLDSCAAFITGDAAAAIDAVTEGKRVLVVDPFALSRELRQKLASSHHAMPALIARFKPSIQQVKRSLDDGRLGEQGLLRIHDWDQDDGAGESAVARELDIALWMFGCQPTEVYSLRQPGYVQVHLGFSGGAMAIIDIDRSLPPGNSYYSLSLIGSTGAAYADDHHNMNLLFGTQGVRALSTSQGDVAVASMIERFVSAIDEGRGFEQQWSDTESALELLRECEVASEDKRVVSVGKGRG